MFIDAMTGQRINDGAHILNGRGYGIGETFQQVRFDPGMLRPYWDSNGVQCVTINTGKTVYDKATRSYLPIYKKVPVRRLLESGFNHPVLNATSLRKDEWIQIDRTVKEVTRTRLQAWNDLVKRSSIGGFNAMGKMTYEYQAISDAGEAVVDLDGMTDARHDEPLFKLRSVPLPITHSDFWFSERRLAVSRNDGTPLDMTMVRYATRKVAEMVEDTLIGTVAGVQYGDNTNTQDTAAASKVYGYTNFPFRITKTDLTTPTGSNPEAVMTDLLEIFELLRNQGFYGPYMVYHSIGYTRYLDDDYFRTGSTSAVRTLRERLMGIGNIIDIRQLDRLTSGYQLIVLQLDADVVQAINGMDVTVVQWDSQGGLRKNFKIMTIQVPVFKAEYDGKCGMVHATTS